MKYIVSLVALSVLFSGLAFAKTEGLPDLGLTPDSPFYFFKTWQENIQTFFAFGAENKARQYLHLADVRLAEYQKLIEEEKMDIAQKTLDKYESQLQRALDKISEIKEAGKDVTALSATVEESITKHLQVLRYVLSRVPEAARSAIQKAIEASSKVIERKSDNPSDSLPLGAYCGDTSWMSPFQGDQGYAQAYSAVDAEEEIFKGVVSYKECSQNLSTLMRCTPFKLSGVTLYGSEYRKYEDSIVEVLGKKYSFELEGVNLTEIWPTKIRCVEKPGNPKLSGILYQLTRSSNYEEFGRKNPSLQISSGSIKIYIHIQNITYNDYVIPSDIGVKQKGTDNIVQAIVRVDKLLQLIESPYVRFIELPARVVPL